MQEQLISFETAKLAKEKGFDLVCTKYAYIKLENNKIEIHDEYKEILKDNPELSLEVYAPTQSLLQRWLRERHQINILVHPIQMNANPIVYLFCLHYKYGSQSKMTLWSETKYSSYEEALEKGLYEALKLI